MIDLHTHSTFSDGSLTPEELVALGKEIGLTALALTDHDTLGGIPRFLNACAALGSGAPEGITGVELSAEVSSGTMHLLGYGIDISHAELADLLHQVRRGRRIRNECILKSLLDLGMEITLDEVIASAGEHVVGRPHFAQALVARGYVKNKQQAFKTLLGKGAPAYRPRFRPSPAECIRLIRQAGGVAVLAHPFTLDLKPMKMRSRVRELRGMGLHGLEVYYPEHSIEKQEFCAKLAHALGLHMTGGSDFHGAMNPDIYLGRGFGSLCVPDTLLEGLRVAESAVN